MARQLLLAQSVISQFGLVVNPDKTEGPAQSLSFLGVQLDSVNQTVSCTPARVEELTTLLRSLLRQRVITRAHAASLIGKLSFAAQVLPGARPFMRRMLDALHGCKSRRHSTPIRIDPGFRDDLRFWAQQLHLWNGRQQWRSSRAAPFVFASDASLRGFGFYLESTPTLSNSTVDSESAPTLSNSTADSTLAPTLSNSTVDSESTPTLHASTVDSTAWPQHLRVGATFSGTYSPEHAHLHQSHTQIAWCELLAVVACASTYGPLLSGQSLLFYVDNSTDVHIINRQATRSKALAGLLRQLYSIALQYNLSIRAQHRPGVDNVLADFLSRPELHKHNHVTSGLPLTRCTLPVCPPCPSCPAGSTCARRPLRRLLSPAQHAPRATSRVNASSTPSARNAHQLHSAPQRAPALRRLHRLRPASSHHQPPRLRVRHRPLRHAHGLPRPPSRPTFDRVKAGLLNWYGDTNFSEPARGFTVADLRAIRAHIDLAVFSDARDWCAALFAFYGLLRIREYTCSGLLRQHVTPHDWGINLAVPFSKTSLIPTAVALIRRGDTLCPVAAHRAYTRLVPARLAA